MSNKKLYTLFVSICTFLLNFFDTEKEIILYGSFPRTGFPWAEHRAKMWEAVTLLTHRMDLSKLLISVFPAVRRIHSCFIALLKGIIAVPNSPRWELLASEVRLRPHK